MGLWGCSATKAEAPPPASGGPVGAASSDVSKEVAEQAVAKDSSGASVDDGVRHNVAPTTTSASAPEPEKKGTKLDGKSYDFADDLPAEAAPAPSVAGTAGADEERRSSGDKTVAKPGEKREADARARPGAGGGGAAYVPAPVAAPAMKAGRHDDNKQYNRFLQFLGENGAQVLYPVDVSERLVIRTVDKDGKSLHNCAVEVKSGKGTAVFAATTYADGKTQFFPADASAPTDRDYAVKATCGKEVRNGQLARIGKRETELRFGEARILPKAVPVDIAFLMDTTGSMQSQIDRLKGTLKAIHFQLTQLSTKPDIRFALVAYRDRGDDYVTKMQGFTADMGQFQTVLDKLEADGGGDTPEDLQEAFANALHKLEWRSNAVRIGFFISDATLHADYGQAFTYRDTMRESLARGIKWVAVGAGGLGRDGEVIFRQVAQFTMGEYVFITEGGGGDAEGGVAEASHHVGSNYTTENLDQAIIRIVRRELSYLTDVPKDFDDTIVATANQGVARDTVLAPAVAEVMRQLIDYSSLKLADKTPVAVVPTNSDKGQKDVAEYLTDQMTLSASRNPMLKVVERDLHAVAQEMKLQLTELFDVKDSVPIGKLVGAEVLIVSKLAVRKNGASLFAKLVRVETGEVLSVANVEFGATVISGS